MAIDSIFLRKPAQTPTHIQTNNPSSPSNFVAISDAKFMLEGHPITLSAPIFGRQ
jgi:hypothetical protein